MVYLREVFMAELTESMADGILPFLFRLVLPFLLTFFYHRRPRLFAKTFTLVRLLALYGVLVMYSSNTTTTTTTTATTTIETGSPHHRSTSNVHISHSPTTHSDPAVRARSGWRGWDSIRDMPWYRQHTLQPAFHQILYMVYFLALANVLATLSTGCVTEWVCGARNRVTQCSGRFGGERILYYGMLMRLLSCVVVAWCARCIPQWTTLFIPETTTLIGSDGETIVRDHLDAMNSILVTYSVVLLPSPFFDFSYFEEWFVIGHSGRHLTDDIDYASSSELSLRIDHDSTAGDRFWEQYFARDSPSKRRPEEAAFVAQAVGSGDAIGTASGAGAETESDATGTTGQETAPHPPTLDDLLEEIDMPVLFRNSLDINSEKAIASTVESLHATFLAGWSRPIHQRKRILSALRCLVVENETAIVAAVLRDLHRPSFETICWECKQLVAEIDYLLYHIDDMALEKYQRSRTLTWPSQQWIRPEPLGVVCVLGNWSFPFLSTLSPLAGALAAGNTVVVQPSHVGTGACAQLLATLIPTYLDRAVVSVVGPGFPSQQEFTHHSSSTCTNYLLQQDLLRTVVFTDRTAMQTKRLVALASLQLIPCLYERNNGNNPVYVDTSVVDMEACAKRVVWSSMMNAGQNRYKPNYVLCHQDVLSTFVDLCQQWVTRMYGTQPEQSSQLGRIATRTNMQALVNVVARTEKYARTFGKEQHEQIHQQETPETEEGKSDGTYDRTDVRAEWQYGFCEVVCGGQYNAVGLELHSTVQERYYAPTILHVSRDVPIMEDEQDEGDDGKVGCRQCGPVLSIVAVKDVHDAIGEINGRARPLAMYIFSDHFETTRTIVAQTRAGGVTINSCLWHTKHVDLSVGGHGFNAGGAPWRGSAAMATFSHMKPVLAKTRSRCCGPCVSLESWIFPSFAQFAALKLWCVQVLYRLNHW